MCKHVSDQLTEHQTPRRKKLGQVFRLIQLLPTTSDPVEKHVSLRSRLELARLAIRYSAPPYVKSNGPQTNAEIGNFDPGRAFGNRRVTSQFTLIECLAGERN